MDPQNTEQSDVPSEQQPLPSPPPATPPLSAEAQSPQPMQPTPTSGGKKKKIILISIAAVLLVVIAAGVAWAVLQGQPSQENNQQKNTHLNSKNPSNIDGIAVNTFRYVNACRAFTYETMAENFAFAARGGVMYNVFAEDGLLVKDIQEDGRFARGVTSECRPTLIKGGKYSGAQLTFKVHQFSTADKAERFYENQYESEAERKEREDANSRLGTSLQNYHGYKPIDSIDSTLFNDQLKKSLTLHDNKILEFGIFGGGESSATFKKSIAGALPDIIKRIDDAELSQAALAENRRDANGKLISSYGQKIGDSTYVDPCTIFTGDDFKTLTGEKANPSYVEVLWHWDPIATHASNIDRGLTKNNCGRETYPGIKGTVRADTYVMYFKTPKQAQDTLKKRIGDLSRPGRDLGDFTEVDGIGGYAAYKHRGGDGGTQNNTAFYVQKGSYVLEISSGALDQGEDRYGQAVSVDGYKNTVSAMIKRLP